MLSAIWLIVVVGYVVFEYQSTSLSNSMFVEVLISKTGEPIESLAGNPFVDLVPVDTRLKIANIGYVMFLPLMLFWLGVYLFTFIYRWVVLGFKNENT